MKNANIRKGKIWTTDIISWTSIIILFLRPQQGISKRTPPKGQRFFFGRTAENPPRTYLNSTAHKFHTAAHFRKKFSACGRLLMFLTVRPWNNQRRTKPKNTGAHTYGALFKKLPRSAPQKINFALWGSITVVTPSYAISPDCYHRRSRHRRSRWN